MGHTLVTSRNRLSRIRRGFVCVSLGVMAKSLHPPLPDPDFGLTAETATKLVGEVRDDLKRLKWFLWHGNVFRALNTVQDIIMDLETLHPDDQPSKLLIAAREFDTYLRANAGTIPNYGERYRSGETSPAHQPNPRSTR